MIFESAHPYLSNTNQTWTYTLAGSPTSIDVYFDPQTEVEDGVDFLYVRDGDGVDIPGSPFTGTELAGAIKTISGDVVKVRLTSNVANEYWGFGVATVFETGTGNLLTWTELRPAGDANKIWMTVSLSRDAQTILAGEYYGRLYLTTNGGTSWTEVRPMGDSDRYWTCTCMSTDGAVMLAGLSNGSLFVSTDRGANWSATYNAGTPRASDWYCVRMTSTGIIVGAAMAPYGYCSGLVKSTDNGAHWTDLHLPYDPDYRGFSSVAIADDGLTIIAAHNPVELYVFVSSDGGATWSQTADVGVDTRDKRVDISPDGKFVSVAENGARLWVSDDLGATWTEVRPSGNDIACGWRGLAIGSKGFNMACGGDVVITDIGHLYISFNRGNSWHEERPGFPPTAIYGWKAMSQIGDYWCVGNIDGRLWISSKLPSLTVHSLPWLGKFQLSYVTA